MGIWGCYNNISKAMFYLLQGENMHVYIYIYTHIFWGLYWAPLIFGKFQILFRQSKNPATLDHPPTSEGGENHHLCSCPGAMRNLSPLDILAQVSKLAGFRYQSRSQYCYSQLQAPWTLGGRDCLSNPEQHLESQSSVDT